MLWLKKDLTRGLAAGVAAVAAGVVAVKPAAVKPCWRPLHPWKRQLICPLFLSKRQAG